MRAEYFKPVADNLQLRIYNRLRSRSFWSTLEAFRVYANCGTESVSAVHREGRQLNWVIWTTNTSTNYGQLILLSPLWISLFNCSISQAFTLTVDAPCLSLFFLSHTHSHKVAGKNCGCPSAQQGSAALKTEIIHSGRELYRVMEKSGITRKLTTKQISKVV